MKTSRFLLLLALLASSLSAQEKTTGGVAALAFLTGHWRGTSSTGTVAEELISAPEGGVMLATGREFQNGQCVFFDLVAFTEKTARSRSSLIRTGSAARMCFRS